MTMTELQLYCIVLYCIVPDTWPLGGNCVHTDVVYGATVTILDNDNVPVDDETQKYVGGTEHFKTRYNAHTRSFRIRDPKIQTSLSNYIWSLKDQDINHVVTWQILEKSRVFNPITMQCLICLSESVKILDPNLASINTRNEIYGFCRHRKKYLLKYAKPLALKGDALTYRY